MLPYCIVGRGCIYALLFSPKQNCYIVGVKYYQTMQNNTLRGLVFAMAVVIVLMGGTIASQQATMAECEIDKGYDNGYFDGFNAGAEYQLNLPVPLNLMTFSGSMEVHNETYRVARGDKLDVWPIYESKPVSFYEVKDGKTTGIIHVPKKWIDKKVMVLFLSDNIGV